mmetsp:Transcript_65351/g.142544  ORF Transcript_65351/g.142544 Transcript_65351/m.142544 type:complete len:361 (+) Transcript_65351:249-1331(+)
MAHAPVATTNAWIKASFLEPRKLIPALMRYDPKNNPPGHTSNQAIRYLHHCARNLRVEDVSIYNLLVLRLAQADDERELIKFLTTDGIEKRVDLKYALRLAHEYKRHQACIQIYSMMGLYEEAVTLSLQCNDIETAKLNAEMPEDDEPLRKKLWLKIARHCIEQEEDIKLAIDFMSQCEVLKIEDILPFLDDFVVIDDFKDEICAALEEYNKHIEDLKRGMDEATASADLIRRDIKELRGRSGFVPGKTKCNLCSAVVLNRQFYLFPCDHVFHCDCLSRAMRNHLPADAVDKVDKLQAQIASETVATANETVGFPGDATKHELDELIASECIFCGDIMIDSITEPFVTINDAEENATWRL